MPLISILSVEIDPGQQLGYIATTANLAAAAREKGEDFKWTAHEAAYGGVSMLHFASRLESFSEMSKRGLPNEMVLRVLGEKKGTEALQQFGAATRNQTTVVLSDRPELSYPPDDAAAVAPFAVMTVINARSGQLEACEELIRKIAEAIPKAGDPARIVTYQTVIGSLSQIRTVRPLNDLADLDAQAPPQELLNQAFGAAEGGVIYRAGLDAIDSVERSILITREELGNPPA